MKTLREMMDLIESAQPVDLRARAAELAIQILKNADMDDDSEQGYIRVDPNALFQFHVLMNTAKKQGVAEMDTYPHPDSKEGKRLTKAIRDPNAPEVKPQPAKKTVKDATKILDKEFQKSVKEDQIEETEVDPVRRIEELFRDKR
jgi:hypothetical protein